MRTVASFDPPSGHRPTRAPRWTGGVRALLAWLILLAVSCPATAQVGADTRVAVVIGNAAYRAAPLANPVNDAAAVAEALRRLGFTVIEVRNAGKAQMDDAVARAAAMLKGRSGVGLLYFAGHGVQIDWHNYLLPVDAEFDRTEDVKAKAVSVQSAIDAFRIAGNRVSIVVLDACRDNPFGGGTGSKGLAYMDAPPGTLLAYATSPGSVAEDGDASDRNGLYTRHLVRELGQPKRKIEDVFKQVRAQVRKQSAGRQIPWESTSLEDDFYFDPGVRVTSLATVEAATRERTDWQRIEHSLREDDFVEHLRTYPDGDYREHARSFLGELQALKSRSRSAAEGVRLPDPRNRYATGDAFDYVRTDGYTSVGLNVLRRVTFADDDVVELNNGQLVWTQFGDVLADRIGIYQPPRPDIPRQLAVGATWSSSFVLTTHRGASLETSCDYKVVAIEDLAVPAGQFKAFKIERNGSIAPNLRGLNAKVWVDSASMTIVRVDTLVQGSSAFGVWESEQLAGVKRAKRRGGS